ncbi:Hypothetical predicted protein [Mytilus galloprovincialis]|uniref:Dynein axonemal intermediate chain 4 n=1 Tax=Mytilus galloprovincialis TaxID=29158 RepID=A0A8B6H4L5_MYTGA|nr:Hypothetical predicted protein [Mytilus galloprovincialis]
MRKQKDVELTIASSNADLRVYASYKITRKYHPYLVNNQLLEEIGYMKSENLLRDLFIMERVVNLNTYQSRQALYRGYPVLTELEKEMSANQQLSVSDMGPNFDRLWSYQCPLTKGRNVSSMSWNKLNPGPVYRVKWSPDDPDVFLSCSADWSVRLWHQERFSPVLTFLSSTKPVYDVAWSPKSATVFACVTENSVEVWDLNMSTLDPLIKSNPTSGAKQTTVSFSRNSDDIGD